MNVVIITSAIITHCATAFNSHQRCEQTMESVESIRKHIPNSFIVLIDATDPGNVAQNLITMVDVYCDASKNQEIVESVAKHKSLGEFILTNAALDVIKSRQIVVDRIFKLSGRYHLTSNFNINDFPANKFTFKKTDNCVHTTLYSINAKHIDFYQQLLKHCAIELQAVDGRSDIEHLLYYHMHPHVNDVNWIDVLNVEGFISHGPLYTA